jgi:hypothetical protein
MAEAVILAGARRIPLTTKEESDLKKWIKEPEYKDLNGEPFFSFEEARRGILCDFCNEHYNGSGLLFVVYSFSFVYCR